MMNEENWSKTMLPIMKECLKDLTTVAILPAKAL